MKPQEAQDRAESLLQFALKAVQAPGAGAAIIHKGRLLYLLEEGHAVRFDDDAPMTANTTLRLGTLTQAITAYATLKLIESGQLTPQTPVNDVLRSFRLESSGVVTVHHLLTHTAGLGAARSLRALVTHDAVYDMVKLVPSLADHYGGILHAPTAPAEKWCFANDGYAVLGQIIADVTGEPLPDAIQRLVFDPLEMHDATFGLPEAVGYKRNGSTAKPIKTPLLGALGACASIQDMARFAAAILTTPAMMTPHYQHDPRLMGMGYGLRVQTLQPDGGGVVAWLNGEIDGFSGALCLAPETQTAVIMLCNKVTGGALGTVARRVTMGLAGLSEPESGESATTSLDLSGYYAPSAGLLTNVELWGAYGGGVSVQRTKSGWALGAQINPSERRDLQPTADPLAFTYESAGGKPLVVFQPDADDTTRASTLFIGLHALYRRPRWHSLGGRLMLATAALFVAFALIVALILA